MSKPQIRDIIYATGAICAIVLINFFFSPAAQAADTCTVNRGANIRSGPSTNYEIVGGKKAGDQVSVQGKNADGSWLQIGTSQWMAAFLLNCVGAGQGGSGTENVPAEGITVSGARNSIPMDQVDYARNGFTSEWPALGHVLAEPGKLVVGPDFPQKLIDESRGAIWRVNPGNQYRLNDMSGTQLDGCAEGALISVAAQHLVATIRDFTVSIKVPDGDNAHLFIKCPFANGQQGSDAGSDVMFSGFKPNAALVQHFSGQPNGGFVSLNGEKQALNISQTGTSSGSEGASNTWLVGLDSNTGAFSVMRWDGQTMHFVASNWYVAN